MSTTKGSIVANTSSDWWIDQIGTLGDDLEFVVGDQRGDLDDDVTRRLQAGHLQVHPDEHGGTA